MTDITIRPAATADAPLVLSLLRELADYEKLLDRFHVTEDSIRRDLESLENTLREKTLAS